MNTVKVEIIGRLPGKVRGERMDIGGIVDMDRKFAKTYIAAGLVRKFRPPRPDIPASPSVPLSVVTTLTLSSASALAFNDESALENQPDPRWSDDPNGAVAAHSPVELASSDITATNEQPVEPVAAPRASAEESAPGEKRDEAPAEAAKAADNARPRRGRHSRRDMRAE